MNVSGRMVCMRGSAAFLTAKWMEGHRRRQPSGLMAGSLPSQCSSATGCTSFATLLLNVLLQPSAIEPACPLYRMWMCLGCRLVVLHAHVLQARCSSSLFQLIAHAGLQHTSDGTGVSKSIYSCTVAAVDICEGKMAAAALCRRRRHTDMEAVPSRLSLDSRNLRARADGLHTPEPTLKGGRASFNRASDLAMACKSSWFIMQ